MEVNIRHKMSNAYLLHDMEDGVLSQGFPDTPFYFVFYKSWVMNLSSKLNTCIIHNSGLFVFVFISFLKKYILGKGK